MVIDPDTLVSYVIGTLSPDEERQVEAWLRDHPEEERRLLEEQEALASMALQLPPAPVTPPSFQDVLSHVKAKEPVPFTPKPNRSRLVPALAFAAVVAGLLVIGVPLTPPYQEWRVQQNIARYANLPGAVSRPLMSAKGESMGMLVRLANGQVFASLKKRPADGRVYQAWEIKGGVPASLGVFGDRSFLSAATVAEGSTFGVTLEQPGGSDRPTSAPVAVTTL
ncbi:anti-sigma factor domain-containing protein [Deinococcus yavapaiensis]|uniref:Regulator of SigK n=1 Tax=Deinococcus yavapaiensis KR-236 TaxID=694435 RepID=A0A318SEH0_9DEIO|nr:anti-sigma factor [Deinococcus yavapaiensis]PYE54912.1 anti-sigma-K factor RskA [Deinococcus yavapaiensis KR-236]